MLCAAVFPNDFLTAVSGEVQAYEALASLSRNCRRDCRCGVGNDSGADVFTSRLSRHADRAPLICAQAHTELNARRLL